MRAWMSSAGGAFLSGWWVIGHGDARRVERRALIGRDAADRLEAEAFRQQLINRRLVLDDNRATEADLVGASGKVRRMAQPVGALQDAGPQIAITAKFFGRRVRVQLRVQV